MKIFRKTDNWMRYRIEKQIRRKHPEVFECIKKNLWLDWIDRQLQPQRWFISVGLTLLVFIFIACLFNVLQLAFYFSVEEKKTHDFGKFIDDRASNLATIASMSMAVIGFLVSNIAIKELYAVKVLFKRTKLSFVIIFALTSLGIFVILSSFRFTYITGAIYNNVVLAAALMLIVVLVLIGFLFIKIIYFVDSAQIDDYMNEQLAADAFVLIKEGLYRTFSEKAYQSVMHQAGVEPYNLSDTFNPDTLKNIIRLINNADVEAEAIKSYVVDLDLGALRSYLHDHKNADMVFHNLYLGAFTELADNYVFVPGKENTLAERGILCSIMIKSYNCIQPPTISEIRKHHDEKLLAMAEAGMRCDDLAGQSTLLVKINNTIVIVA